MPHSRQRGEISAISDKLIATRAVPPEQRGRAVGGFIAFFDIALGLTGPILGLVVGHAGIGAAFLVGACATLMALVLVPTIGGPGRPDKA